MSRWLPPSRWGRCWCWRTLSHCPGWWWTLTLSLQLKAHLYRWHPTLQQFPQPYFLVLYLHTAQTHTNRPFHSSSTSDVWKFSLIQKWTYLSMAELRGVIIAVSNFDDDHTGGRKTVTIHICCFHSQLIHSLILLSQRFCYHVLFVLVTLFSYLIFNTIEFI